MIVDAPSVLASGDVLHLIKLAEGTLFVVRAGVTPTSLVEKALAQLDRDKLLGVVLNGSRSSVPNWLRRLCGL